MSVQGEGGGEDKCKEGYWDIAGGCQACRCNKMGTKHYNKETGVCTCIKGVGLDLQERTRVDYWENCDRCSGDLWIDVSTPQVTIENDNTVEVSEVNVTVTISNTAVCPFTENINIVFNTKPVTEPTTSTSTDDTISKTTFILKWFKTYDVIMTACTNPNKTWSNETCKNNTLVHDTNNFMCGDINNTLISREKLCNDPLFPDCPNDLDES